MTPTGSSAPGQLCTRPLVPDCSFDACDRCAGGNGTISLVDRTEVGVFSVSARECGEQCAQWTQWPVGGQGGEVSVWALVSCAAPLWYVCGVHWRGMGMRHRQCPVVLCRTIIIDRAPLLACAAVPASPLAIIAAIVCPLCVVCAFAVLYDVLLSSLHYQCLHSLTVPLQSTLQIKSTARCI